MPLIKLIQCAVIAMLVTSLSGCIIDDTRHREHHHERHHHDNNDSARQHLGPPPLR